MRARRLRQALLAGTALLPMVAAAQGVAPNAAPTGGRVVAGAASIAQTATTTTINQSTGRAAVDWNSFNVGANQTVQFNQPNAQSWTLNRVTTPDPSVIAGRITANGGIAIVNQSGVVFAEGAQVNVANLIASAAGITNQDFMAGRMAFTGAANPGARVENRGTITVADQGLAVLAGPRAANSGTINARLGRVALQGAEAFTLDLAGDGLLSLDVTQQVRSSPDGAALVTNSGTINARGGSVQLNASAISGVVETLVNNTLVNNTGRIAVGGGQAVLRAEGGGATAGGAITARSRAGQGGSISVSATGNVVVPTGATLDASGGAGGGRVAVGSASTRGVTVAAGAALRADATRRGNGGNVVVNSATATTVQGQLAARGGPLGGDGGLVETSSGAALLLATLPDVTAPAGRNGTWLLDPVNIIIRSSAASGASEIDGSLTAGAYTTNGAAGDPTSVIIAPSTIQGYSGDVVLTATDTIGVLSSVTRTAGQGALTLSAGNAVVLAAALSVADGITLQSTTGNLSLTTTLTTARTAAISLSAGGSVIQTASNIVTTGSLGVTAHGAVSLGLSNVVDSVNISAAGQSVGFVSNQALSVTGLSAANATLVAPSLNITGASAGTTSIALTATAGGIQQSAVITTPSLTATATGGDIALGQANAVDQVAVTANGRSASFTSANALNVLASSAAALAITGRSLSITGALGGTTSINLASTNGGISQSGIGLLNTNALTATATGGDIALGLSNPVNNASLTASGHAATLVSTAGLTLEGSAATVEATAPSLALGALVGTTSIRLLATGGGSAVTHAGASGVLTTPDLGITSAGTVALGRQNAVDKVAISAIGQTASFTSANALEVAASSAVALSLTGASLNLTGAVAGTTSVALTSTAGGMTQSAAGLVTTPSLTLHATGGDIALGEANAVDATSITASAAATLVSANALAVNGASGTAVDLTATVLTLQGAVGGTTSVVLTSTAGGMTQAASGLVTTPSLSLHATGGDIALGRANAVDAASIIASGAATLVSTQAMTVNGASGAALDITGLSLALQGAVGGTTSVVLTSTGGGMTQTAVGLVTTPSLTLHATGGDIALGRANAVDAAAITASGAATLVSSQALTVNGASGTALDITGLSLALQGAVGGTTSVGLTSTGGGITQSATGIVTTPSLALHATGGDIALGRANAVDATSITASAAATLVSAQALTVNGASGTALDLTALSLALQGPVGGTTGVALTSTAGGMTQTAAGLVTTPSLTLHATGGDIALGQANAVDAAGITASAAATLVSTQALTVNGASGTALDITGLSLALQGAVGGTTSVGLTSTGGGITQTAVGLVTTPALTLHATGGDIALGQSNAVDAAGITASAAATLVSTQALTVNGASGTALDITGLSLALQGAVGGTTSVGLTSTAGGMTQTALGLVTTPSLTLHATGGDIALGQANAVDAASITATGAATLVSTQALTVTGASGTVLDLSALSLALDGAVAGSTSVALSSDGAISQVGGSLTTPLLTVGGATGAKASSIALTQTGNVIARLDSASATGSVAVTSNGATGTGIFTVGDVTGAAVTLTSHNAGGTLSLTGTVDAGAGLLDLHAMGNIATSGAVLKAGSFAANAGGNVTVEAGIGGALPSILASSAAASGSLSITQLGAASVDGAITAGSITIASDNALTVSATGSVSGGVVRLAAGKTSGALTLNGAVGGTTAVLLTAGDLSATPAAGADILQGSGGVVTTPYLAFQANGNVSLTAANHIDRLGGQALGTLSITDAVAVQVSTTALGLGGRFDALRSALTSHGDLTLDAPGITIGSGATLSSSAGSLAMKADAMDLAGSVGAAISATLKPLTADTGIQLGGSAASGVLRLDVAQIAALAAPIVSLQASGTGAVSIAADADLRLAGLARTFDLRGSSVTQTAGTALSVERLTGSATTGDFRLDNAGNSIDAAGGIATAQDLSLRSAASLLAVDGTLSAGNGRSVTLRADDIALTGAVQVAGGGTVNILPHTSGTAISLGGASGYLGTAELNRIATGGGLLRIGSDGSTTTAGDITLAGYAALRSVAATLELRGASVTQSAGALDVATLRGATSNGASFGSSSNSIDTLAGFTAGGDFLLRDAAALTVSAAVGTGTGGSLTLQADALTLSAGLSAPGALGSTHLLPLTSGLAVTLGDSSTPTGLYLPTAALNRLATGGTLFIGRDASSVTTAGAITLAGDVLLRGPGHGSVGVLRLDGASVAQTGGLLDVAKVIGATTGNVSLTRAGNRIDEVNSIVAGGDVAVTSAVPLTVATAIAGTDRAITLRADALTLAGVVNAGGSGGSVTLQPLSADTGITVGTSGGGLLLDPSQLTANISTTTLILQANGTGAIGLASDLNLRSGANVLNLQGASVSQTAGTVLDVAKVTGSATAGSFALDSHANTFDAAGAITATGDVALTTASSLLTVYGGVSAGTGNTITLRADDLALNANVSVAGAGMINILPHTSGQTISLGGPSGYLSQADLTHISVRDGLLRIGSDGSTTTAGTISFAGGVDLRGFFSTGEASILDLRGASVAQNGTSLNVATLTGATTGDATFEGLLNKIDTLAGFTAGRDFLLRDLSSLTVSGATSAGSGNRLTLQTDSLTLSAALSAPGGGTIGLLPRTSGLAVTLGDSATPVGLYLPSAAIDRISTVGGTLEIGGGTLLPTTAGAITLAGDVRLRGSGHGDANLLRLNGSSVNQTGGVLDVSALAGTTTGDFLMTRAGNRIDQLSVISAGGDLAVTSAVPLTAGTLSAGTDKAVTLTADALTLTGTVGTGGSAGSVTLKPLSADTGITVGASGSGLLLDAAQLAANIATNTLVLQATGTGGVALASSLNLRSAAGVLDLHGASVSQTAGTVLDVAKVSGAATAGSFELASQANTFDAAGAISATGNVALTTASSLLTVSGAVAAGNGNSITLRADDIALTGSLSAPGAGTVNLLPYTAGTAISLGGAGGYLGTAELNAISTGGGLLRVGSDGTTTTAGAITLAGTVALRGGAGQGDAATLDLRGGSVAQSGGALDVTTLTGATSGDFSLQRAANSIDTLGNLSAANITLRDALALNVSGTVQAGAAGTLALTSAGALSIAGTASLQAGTRAGADTGVINLWGASIALSGPVQAGNLVTLVANDSRSAGPTAAVAGADITQSGLGVITTRRLGTAAAGTTSLTLANVVDRAVLFGQGSLGFNSSVALALQGGLAAPIPDGGSYAIGNGAAGFTATSAAGLSVNSAITAPSGDVTLTGAGTITLAADITATAGSIAVTAQSPSSALIRSGGTLSATAANQRITLTADSMDFGNPGAPVLLANASTGLVRLQAYTAGLDISLGAVTPGQFSVTNTTGGLVDAARLSIGDVAGGAITLGGSFNAGTTTLELLTAGAITQSAGVLTSSGLSATAGGAIMLAGANAIGAINGSTADAAKGLTAGGEITLTDTQALTLNAAVTSGTGGTITLRTDALHIASTGAISAPGGGTVNLLPDTSGTAMQLGGPAPGSGFHLGDAEVARIATGGGLLRIGSDGTTTTAGAITLAGTVALRGGAGQGDAATLDLRGASVAQSGGALDVATLTGATSGDFSLQRAGNSLDTLGNLSAANITLRDALALNVSGTVQAGAAGTLALTSAGALSIAGTASLQAGTRAGADTGVINLWGASIALSGPVQAGNLVTLVANDSRSAGPTAAVAGADITQSGLGVITTRRLGTAAAGTTSLTLANVVDRAVLFGQGSLGFNSSVALALQGGLAAPIPDGGSYAIGNGAAGFTATSAAGLSVNSAITAPSGDVTLTGAGTITLAADITATAGSIAVTAQSPSSALIRSGGTLSATAANQRITLTADSMDFGNPGAPVLLANASTGLVRLQAYTARLDISLGTVTPGQFSVTNTTGGLVNAARLSIGDVAGGAITLGGSFNAGTTTLELLTAGAITQSAGNLTTTGLSATAGGAITLGSTGNSIASIEGSTADAGKGLTAGGDIALTTTAASLAVNAAIAVPSAGTMTIIADDLALAARLVAPGGLIRLHPLSTSQAITLGTTAAPAGLYLDSTEIALIGGAGAGGTTNPAARLRIGTDTGGAIVLAGNVDLRNNTTFDADRVQVLELRSAGTITQAAGKRLNVAGLALRGTAIALDSSANAFDRLVGGTSGTGSALNRSADATTGDLALTTTRGLTVAADVAAGGSIGLTAAVLTNNADIAATTDVTLTATATAITNTGSIGGRDVTLGAQSSVDNQTGASIAATRDLSFGQGNGEVLINAGSLTAGTGAAGGNATLNGSSVTNSGSIAAGTASLPGDVSITSSATGIHNQASGSITAAGTLTLTATTLAVTNDGTLTSGIGTAGGDITVQANQLTNNAAMQAGSATLPGAIGITLGNAGSSTLTQSGTGSMAAADGISIGTAGAAVAATLAGSITAGQRAPADATLTLPGGSFSLSGSIGARDVSLSAATGSTTGTAAITAGRDLALTIGAIGTALDGSHTAGRDVGVSVTGAGNALALAGSWVAQRNVGLSAPGGITVNGLVGTDGTGSDGVVDVQSSGGALTIASGGLLYGRRLQGALGATTSLVEVPHSPGQSGVAFAELGTLNVGGDFNFTVTDAALLPYSINGIVSVGSGRTLQLAADDLDITALGGLRAPAGVIAIGPTNAGRDMILGRSGSGALTLDSLELGRIGSSAAAATQVALGSTTLGATAANITLGGTVDFGHAGTARANQLSLQALGSITQEAGATLVADSLTGSAGGSISLDPGGSTNRIYALADLSAGNLLSVRSDVAQLAVTGAVSVSNAGIGVQSLQLRVDDIDIQPGGSLAAPGGWLWLAPITPGRGVTLGGDVAGTLSVDAAELARIGPIARFRVGDVIGGGGAPVAGNITIAGASTIGGLPVLDLRSGGSVLGSGGAVTMGLVEARAAGDVLLDNAGNSFTVGTITAGPGRIIRLAQAGAMLLAGPVTAPGGLVALAAGNGISQQPGAVITAGTLTLQAGGQLALTEANDFATLGASSVGGGALRGLTYSVTGPLVAAGDLTLIADGALTTPGNVTTGGALTLVVGGTVTLGGTTSVAGDLTIGAGQSVVLGGTTGAGGAFLLDASNNLTINGGVSANLPLALHAGNVLAVNGSVSSGGALSLTGGNGLSLAGAITAGGALALSTGGALSLPGSVAAGGSVTLASGGATTLAGTLTSGGDISATAGGTASFTGRATAAGRFSLSASSSMLLTGTLAADSASLRAAAMTLDGLTATIGRAIVFSGPGGITAGATTTINARTAGQYPAVVFDTRRATHTDPLGLVQPDIAGRLDSQQATQVRRPGQQAPGTFGATSSASAGVLTLAVSAGSSPVFLLLDGGVASGFIAAGRLGVHGTGGSVSLLGTLAGVPGSAAAASADITRPIDPTLQSNYRINGCVVASINCVPPPSIQFIAVRPPEVVDLSLVNNRIDTSEVTIPNVAEIEYQ